MFAEWKDAILGNIKKYLRDNVYGPIPGIIVNVDDYESTQMVDVQLSVSRRYQNNEVMPETGCTLYGCPFVNPGIGEGGLTFPPEVGNPVLVIFGCRNMDTWKLSDGLEELAPVDSRYMSKTDAIVIPGCQTISSHITPNPDNVELRFKDNILSFRPDGTIYLSNGAASYTINPDGSTVETNGSGTKIMQASGVFNINGFVINTDGSASSPVSVTAPTVSGTSSLLASGAEVVSHTHGGVDSGTSNTDPLS